MIELNIRRVILVVIDIMCVAIAAMLALVIRFEGSIDPMYWNNLMSMLPLMMLYTIIIGFIVGMYRSLWQYASIREMGIIVVNGLITIITNLSISSILATPMPRSFYLLNAIFLIVFSGGVRFVYRSIRLYTHHYKMMGRNSSPVSNIMVIGGGDAGNLLIRDLIKSDKYNKRPRVVIDDDKSKWGRTLLGVPIYGGRNSIIDAVNKYNIDEIYVVMPSAEHNEIVKVLDICKETKCRLMKLPGMYQFFNGEVSINQFKEVEIKDLLSRKQIEVNLSEIIGYVTGKVVIVTGGGGSIGSELCKQIANAKPKKLVIVDIYENNAYDLQQYLRRNNPELDFDTMIASVRDRRKMNFLFKKYQPDLVYHAAAHKHVPLMEDSPNEAVKNNVFGTLNVAQAADKYGVDKMVLISTDKAVNPTNIMGATKRMCEMIVQTMNKKSNTEYVAVRFGNVLGSNGSVIPLFTEQIKNGGPVTVTDKNIIRYFMTIPEAVSLILEAGAYAKGGEIFILDMGEPVRIDDLARNLIKLSGYTPDVDIEIKYTGLRPGEKLYEELLMAEEGLQNTPNNMIHIGKPIEFDEEDFFGRLEELFELAYQNNDEMKQFITNYVPTYTPDLEHKL